MRIFFNTVMMLASLALAILYVAVKDNAALAAVWGSNFGLWSVLTSLAILDARRSS